MLRRVGFYRELYIPDTIATGSIHEAVRTTPGSDEDQLVDYLQSGHVLWDVTEQQLDVVGGQQILPGSASLLTDGTWVWRLDLAYYLHTYHLHLPDEFTEHAKAAGYRIPDLPHDRLKELVWQTGVFHENDPVQPPSAEEIIARWKDTR